MTYKGDSVGKKLFRVKFWRAMRQMLTEERFDLTSSFLYLASYEGGDASVLSALGIPPERQLAVDRDPESLREFSKRWPKVPTASGDVAEVTEGLKRRFDVVYLDFCSQLTGPLITTMSRTTVAAGVPLRPGHGGGLVAFTYKRGREQVGFDAIVANRGKGAWNGRKRFGSGLTSGEVSPGARAFDGRHDYLTRELDARLAMKFMGVSTSFVDVYSSKSEESPGSSMETSCYMLWDFKRFRRGDLGFMMDAGKLCMLRKAQEGDSKPVAQVMDMTEIEATPSTLVRAAAEFLSMGYSNEQIPLLLNVDPRSLAAWRAHETRGTYA